MKKVITIANSHQDLQDTHLTEGHHSRRGSFSLRPSQFNYLSRSIKTNSSRFCFPTLKTVPTSNIPTAQIHLNCANSLTAQEQNFNFD